MRFAAPFHLFLITAVFLLQISGCGGSGCVVIGRVTANGEPLSSGHILFSPQSPEAKAVETEIVDGSFRIDSAAKMLPGTYKVTIEALRPTGRKIEADEGSTEMVDELEQYIPEKYNFATTLSAEIEPRTEGLNFELAIPKR